jgi:hypothetical protein
MDNTLIVRAVLIVGASLVLFWLISNYNSKQSTKQAEKFYQQQVASSFADTNTEFPFVNTNNSGIIAQVNEVSPAEEAQESEYRPVTFETKKISNDCFPKDRLTAEDLLPKDAANNKWSQVAPAGQGDLSDQNFLTAGFHVGVDTVQSSLRNANLQLRSEPPIPKSLGWGIHMSTIDPDLLRKPLDTNEW